jgi:uncharacterized membrane protein YdjX (TVP38/TMEM64 family)
MTAGRASRVTPSGAGSRRSLIIGLAVSALPLGLCAWLIVTDAPAYRFVVRVYEDKQLMHAMLDRWGVLAPVVFIAIQALQVIIAPIPGDVTGLLGGFVFGQGLGFFYSTLGLTIGSLGAFGVGRWLGAAFVQGLVGPQVWERMGFLVEAEGAILCFIIYLIPGLPKDIVCYLFGVSPMPFWIFAVVSTLGRMPGTWALSAQGAKAAAGEYVELLLLTALVVSVALPLYYYRSRIMAWFQARG